MTRHPCDEISSHADIYLEGGLKRDEGSSNTSAEIVVTKSICVAPANRFSKLI